MPRLHEVSQREGVSQHRSNIDPRDVVLVDGLPCTSLVRTLADVALTQPQEASIVMLDDALHRGLITVEQLQNVRAILRCRTGAPRARKVIDLADGRSESPFESLSRLRFIQLGLKPTALQYPVMRGSVQIARGDFYFKGQRAHVIGEADGTETHAGEHTRAEDEEREEGIRQLGLQVVRWTWWPFARNPMRTVARIRSWL